jgi:hypothetical protein
MSKMIDHQDKLQVEHCKDLKKASLEDK